MNEKSSTMEQVVSCVATALEVERTEIDQHTCAANMPLWDSLAHLMIINAVERNFGIKLPRLESYTVKNVGELALLVERQMHS